MAFDTPIYDSLPDPVIHLDEHRTVIYANIAARELLDCRAEGADLAMSIRHPVVLDAIDKFLGIMGHEAIRMRQLIEDLLSLSKVEANEHVRPRGRADVEAVVRGVADILETRAQENDAIIDLTVFDSFHPVVGDVDQLTQVFRNLIENALIHGGDAARTAGPAGNPGSTGLGLAIVNRHRGQLQIESEPGEGATFSVYLPTD